MTSRAAARRRRQREVAARWDQLQGLQQIEETPETDSNGFLHVGAEDKGSVKSEKIAIANDKGHRTELQGEKTIGGAAANTNDTGTRNELQVENTARGAASNTNDKGHRNEPQVEKTVRGAAANTNDKGHRNEPQIESVGYFGNFSEDRPFDSGILSSGAVAAPPARTAPASVDYFGNPSEDRPLDSGILSSGAVAAPPAREQFKQFKKTAGNLAQIKDDVVAKQKEIQPMVQKESDLYRKKIGEFEEELKAYQGGMRKEAYYFYKFGLELAMKRLTDVTADLDRFDQRMEDLNHIAVHFQYPEELAKPRKCMQAMRDDVANWRTIWEYAVLNTNDKGTRTEPQGEKTREKRKKKNKEVQAPRDDDFAIDPEECRA